jgi:cell wall-associated NlpC family hydrolase
VGCRTKEHFIRAENITDTTIFTVYSDLVCPTITSDSDLQQRIIAYAKTQIGVPYKYCAMTPSGGFDCSGFVNYVFNHFSIPVPRASVDFTNIGLDIPLLLSQPGDLILFTGTNPHRRVVGHLGIIIANRNGEISFIQSTSGFAYGVVISELDKSYRSRFVKVIRILK